MMLRRYKNKIVGGVAENATSSTVITEEKEEKPIQAEKIPSEEELTKTGINRMNASTAREVAIKHGLVVEEEESGASIKKRLIALLGL